jgi:hypothetical protein
MTFWFVIIWLTDDFEVESCEMRGAFEDIEFRNNAIEEVQEDILDRHVVIIPIDLEGDEEATLEVGEI